MDVNFFATFDGELGGGFGRAGEGIAGSTQSAVLSRDVLGPDKSREADKLGIWVSISIINAAISINRRLRRIQKTQTALNICQSAYAKDLMIFFSAEKNL